MEKTCGRRFQAAKIKFILIGILFLTFFAMAQLMSKSPQEITGSDFINCSEKFFN